MNNVPTHKHTHTYKHSWTKLQNGIQTPWIANISSKNNFKVKGKYLKPIQFSVYYNLKKKNLIQPRYKTIMYEVNKDLFVYTCI